MPNRPAGTGALLERDLDTDVASTSNVKPTTAAVAKAKADAALTAAKAYADSIGSGSVSVVQVRADDGTNSGLKDYPANPTSAQRKSIIDYNSALVRAMLKANPNKTVQLDPSIGEKGWPLAVLLDEMADSALTPGARYSLTGPTRLGVGSRTSSSSTTAADGTTAVIAAPVLKVRRKAGDPIAVSSIDYALQLGPNLPGAGLFTVVCTGFAFSSGYNRFRTGQSLFLYSNDYYAYSMRAVNANNVWQASWVPVGGILIGCTSYSLTALNAALGLTGSNQIKSMERRTVVGVTSGTTGFLQGDMSANGTGQMVANSISGDFTAGENLKDQATNAVIGTYSLTRVLMAGKLNRAYSTSPVVRIGVDGNVDVSGLTVTADSDPDLLIADYNRSDAIELEGVVGVRADGVRIRSGFNSGVRLRSCYRYYLDVDSDSLPNHALEDATTTDGAYGYVVSLMGATDTGVVRVRAAYGRHARTTRVAGATYNGTAAGTNYWSYGPGARNSLTTGTAERMYGQAWDQHEGEEDATFVDVVARDSFGGGRGITGPDGIVLRGFGATVIDPYLDGVGNGVSDGGVALDDGGINFGAGYTNRVLGGVMKNLQGVGLNYSDFHANSTGQVYWRDVDIEADPGIASANLQTVGFWARSGRAIIEGLRVGGVNYAMGILRSQVSPGSSTNENVGNNAGRLVLSRMRYDWTRAAAVSCIRLESEFARVGMFGAELYTNPTGSLRPQYVIRAFVSTSVLNGQSARGNATPIDYAGIRAWSLGSLQTAPGLLNQETTTGVTAAAVAAYVPEITVAGQGPGSGGGSGSGSAFQLRGAWASSTVYAVNDVVTYQGSSYAASTAHTSTSTFDSSKWQLLAQKGSDGTVGPIGPGSVGANIPAGMDQMSPYVRVGANAAMPTPTGGGVFYAYPYPVRVTTSVAALVAQVGTPGVAASGGTMSAKWGLWGDAGGYPDLASGPIVQGTFDLTSAASKRTLTYGQNLLPGTYWVGFLYLASAAPATAPSLYLVNSASWNLALAAGSSFANAVGAWQWTSVADFPTSMSGVSNAGSNAAPVIGFRGGT